MALSNQVEPLSEGSKDLEAERHRVEENAKQALVDALGGDVSLIRTITLNADTGKFNRALAPEHVLFKLKAANLLEPEKRLSAAQS